MSNQLDAQNSQMKDPYKLGSSAKDGMQYISGKTVCCTPSPRSFPTVAITIKEEEKKGPCLLSKKNRKSPHIHTQIRALV